MFKKICVFFTIMVLASAVAAQTKIYVQDHDTGEGINSRVYHNPKGSDEPNLLGKSDEPASETQEYGLLLLDELSCDRGDTIFARPLTAGYYERSWEEACTSKNVSLSVRKLRVNDSIADLADKYVRAGAYGKAAQAYNELATIHPYYFEKVIINAGKVLGMNEDDVLWYDRDQIRRVSSEAFVARIRAFQRQNGLPVDGKVGTKTLEVLAGGSVSRNVLRSRPGNS